MLFCFGYILNFLYVHTTYEPIFARAASLHCDNRESIPALVKWPWWVCNISRISKQINKWNPNPVLNSCEILYWTHTEHSIEMQAQYDIANWKTNIWPSVVNSLWLGYHMASTNWGTIASSNDLSLLHRKAITWTNGHLLPRGQLGTNSCGIRIRLQRFHSRKRLHLKCRLKIVAILFRLQWFNWFDSNTIRRRRAPCFNWSSY